MEQKEQKQVFTLSLELIEIQAIGSALMEAPTKIGMPILQKLEMQLQAQFPKQEEKPEAKEVQLKPQLNGEFTESLS